MLTVAIATLAVVVPSQGEPGEALIPLRDSRTSATLQEVERLLEEAELPGAIQRVQRLHERIWGQNILYAPPSPTHATARVSIPATRYIIGLLRSLPPEGLDHYQNRYDLAANALYRRALELNDPEELVRCYEIYPISSTSHAAALAAGDLFFERGEFNRARASWSFVASEDESRYVPEFHGRLELLTQAEGNGADDPPTVGQSPPLPFWNARLEWAHALSTPSGYSVTRIPCLWQDWLWVATLQEVTRFHLRTGQRVPLVRIPPPTQNRVYREKSRFVVQAPVTDGERLVFSYVRRANLSESYRGFPIRNTIPQRALKAVALDTGITLWDTGDPAGPGGLLANLSFNAPAIIVGKHVYALGWRHSGYINCYLVCLDAQTGDLVWETLLVGNQVELTIFGEISTEPFLGGLYHETGVLYVSTNLGAVARVRSWDGRVDWLTEYPALKPVRINYRRGYQRFARWQRNPVVGIGERIILTPHDSGSAFALHKDGGVVLQQESYRDLGEHLLGRHGDHVVFQGKFKVILIPHGDFSARPQAMSLRNEPKGRAAIVSDGIVYGSDEGLHYRKFSGPSRAELTLFAGNNQAAPRTATQGTITIIKDRIVVTSSKQISCFTKRLE